MEFSTLRLVGPPRQGAGQEWALGPWPPWGCPAESPAGRLPTGGLPGPPWLADKLEPPHSLPYTTTAGRPIRGGPPREIQEVSVQAALVCPRKRPESQSCL